MNNKTKTIVSFILDKSGSMSGCTDATINGYNEYIDNLKKDKKADISMSLTLFDTKVEQLYVDKKLSAIKKLTAKEYMPDGYTALYDAVCKTIKSLEKKVSKKQKSLVVILTDGQENASSEYNRETMRKMIEELQKKGNWTFVFLGANQDSWANASTFGMNAGNVSNYTATSAGMSAVFKTMAANTVNLCRSADMSASHYFSADDKTKLENTK